MATEDTETLVYDSWGAGEFGTMAPTKAAPGSWTGRNMVVYASGYIGPRPGARRLAQNTSAVPTGKLLGLGFSATGAEEATPIFFIIGTRVFLFDPGRDNSVTEANASLSQAPPDTGQGLVLSAESTRNLGASRELYFPVLGDKVYRLNTVTQTLNAVDDSPGGSDIETYRDRTFVATAQTARVAYSAPATAADFPPANFFDVGTSWAILAMSEFRDSMVLFTQSGTWVLTGQPETGTLRRISDTLAPRANTVLKTNDDLLYIPSSRSAPVSFNGSYGDELTLAHLENWKGATNCFGVHSYANRDAAWLSSEGEMLWRKNETWTYHTIDVDDVGPWITRFFDDVLILVTKSDSSSRPKFYGLAVDLNRPAFTSDRYAQPGDETNTPLQADLTLPDYFHPAGRNIKVRQVIVDFIKYDTGASATNNIDLKVETLARLRQPGSGSTPYTAAFNEPGSQASTSGVRDRLVLAGGNAGFSGGLRVSLNNIRGVTIDRVLVDIETEEGRPRA